MFVKQNARHAFHLYNSNNNNNNNNNSNNNNNNNHNHNNNNNNTYLELFDFGLENSLIIHSNVSYIIQY